MGQSRSLATGSQSTASVFLSWRGNLRLAGAQGGGTSLVLRKILHKSYTNFTQIFSLSFDFSPLPAISCREDDAVVGHTPGGTGLLVTGSGPPQADSGGIWRSAAHMSWNS